MSSETKRYINKSTGSILTITSDLSEVKRARDWVSTLAHQAGFSAQENYELQLAVSEACSNAIKHAYDMVDGHNIELLANVEGRRIQIVVKDFGKKLDLNSYQQPKLDQPGEDGYGIYLIRRLTDESYFDTSPDRGTKVTLVKYSTRPNSHGKQ